MKYAIAALLLLSACSTKPETLGQCVDKVMAHFKIPEGTQDMVVATLVCAQEKHNSAKIIQVVEDTMKGKK